jgi:hypothetical protein
MSKARKSPIEVLGIWKSVQNPNSNYGKFAVIRSQAVRRTSITVLTKKDEDFIGFKPLEFEGFKTNAGLNSIWEQVNYTDFNSVEFDGIKMLAGFNCNEMQVITTSPALKQIKE